MRKRTLSAFVGVTTAAAVAGVAAFAGTSTRSVSGADTITRIAGSGKPTPGGEGTHGFAGDGGPATSALLDAPRAVAVDPQGNVYIADSLNNRVRRVRFCGTISTFAGTGSVGFSGDGGPATAAQLNGPFGVAADNRGHVYISDRNNERVRRVDARGTITTYAGTGGRGVLGDGGPATRAQLYLPEELAVDAAGNLYIADSENRRVRKVSTTGILTTVAGGADRSAYQDGIPATSARLDTTDGVAVDARGNIYIATNTAVDGVVRKVSGGIITTVAGSREGDGRPPTVPRLAGPRALAVDGQGNVYIAEDSSSRVRKVDPAGTITTVAGTGFEGFSGDGGPARRARLFGPQGLALDREGNLYIADTVNARVRKVWTAKSAAAAPKLALDGDPTQRLLSSSGITLRASCDKPCSLFATGMVRILGTTYRFELTPARAKLAAVCSRRLTLRLAVAEHAPFRTLMQPNREARAVIVVRAAGQSGRTSTSTRRVAVQ